MQNKTKVEEQLAADKAFELRVHDCNTPLPNLTEDAEVFANDTIK